MSIKNLDPKIDKLIQEEFKRQKEGLVLIPSENYASKEALRAMGTPLSNKYSEGYPDARYYPGNKYIDKIEKLAISRAKEVFNADHANVQPHSGSQANAAIYLALLEPGDTVLGFDLQSGGHLTHGSSVNFSGKTYDFHHYGVSRQNQRIDFKEVEQKALEVEPKIIIASTTSYPRELEFKKFKEVADKVGAYLMADIAHIAGLVAGKVHPHPFPYCDIVTATTHKTLRGPRGGLILCKGELAEKVDKGLFPGTQGGPLDHVIAGKAICFKEAQTKEFKKYQEQIVKNAKAMAKTLKEGGLTLISGGTDNHLMLIDLTNLDYSSKDVEGALESVGIYANRNAIPFDPNPPFKPSGLRLGSPAITSRGMKEEGAEEVANLMLKTIENIDNKKELKKIKKEVKSLAKQYPIYENFEWD